MSPRLADAADSERTEPNTLSRDCTKPSRRWIRPSNRVLQLASISARASMLTAETEGPWCSGGITSWSSSARMAAKPASRWPVASCIWACAVPMWAVHSREASASRSLKSASTAPLTTDSGVRAAPNQALWGTLDPYRHPAVGSP